MRAVTIKGPVPRTVVEFKGTYPAIWETFSTQQGVRFRHVGIGSQGRFSGFLCARADGSQSLADPEGPMRTGDTIVIFCNELGAVNPSVETGTAAPSDHLSSTR